jgi:hypothetical protein
MYLTCRLPLILLLLSSMSSQLAFAATRDALHGWGPCSFSMSRAEAKAAVGPQGIINSAGNMSYETSIDGRTFGAMISFEGAGDRIRWIELRGEGIGKLSVADCHAEREALQHKLSNTYGDPDVNSAEKDESILNSRSGLWLSKPNPETGGSPDGRDEPSASPHDRGHDMRIRNLSPATQRCYVHAVAKFSQYFKRSPAPPPPPPTTDYLARYHVET